MKKRNTKDSLRGVFIAYLFCVCLAISAQGEMREWTSSAGSKIQAEFVSREGDVITFRTDEGREIKVRLNQLSTEDQMYLANITSPIVGQSGIVLKGTQIDTTVILHPGQHGLNGEYFVEEGKELIIKAGAEIVAEKGASISVAGTFRVEGSLERPVIFKSRTATIGSWGGIHLQASTESSVVNFVSVSHATSGMQISNGKPLIENSVLKDNTTEFTDMQTPI